MAPEVMIGAGQGAVQAARGAGLKILLEPVSHPELAPIQVQDSLFAIGRSEAPFDGYPPELAADLSRRHARLFCEGDAVYVADLGSTNGTSVNGIAVKRAIATLRSGDLLGLGKALSYRVRIEPGAVPPPRARLASLTLAPEEGGAGLQPIVITDFPFMVSKTEDSFARYRDTSATQVNYLSRRHAHIFLKGGAVYVEDLGSTNGSFVNGRRLDEHAVALHEGDLLAFGGHHFVYRVGMAWQAAPAGPAPDLAPTRIGAAGAPAAAGPAGDADKTTFVAAADSFLNIFCVDPAPGQDQAPDAAAPAPHAREEAPARPRGKAATIAAGLAAAFGGKDGAGLGRLRRRGMAAAATVLLLAWLASRVGGPEREAQRLLADGAYARAAALAGAALADDPGNTQLQSLDTEALLKASLPGWMASVRGGRLQRAAVQVGEMRRHARGNPELAPLLDELDWIVRLETVVAARGGAQAPIRDAADGARVALLLKQWDEQNAAQQRAFMTMSAYVPAFRDVYADALSDVRKLALARGQP